MLLTVPSYNYPAIFKPVQDRRTKEYRLEYVDQKFNVPDKFYGEIQRYLEFYWSAFKKHNFSAGVMLIGPKGSGKTDLAKTLCNRCIDYGLKVVLLNNVKYTDELVMFLDTLDKVVYFGDEFGKTFYSNIQEKMLTLLSNNNGLERVTIITENSIGLISQFIRNRPGRIRYSKTFSKLSKETILEVAADMTIRNDFLQELLDNYDSLSTFSFDHLKAIFTEHENFPDMDFKTIVGYLNLDFMSGVKALKLIKCEYKNTDIPIEDVLLRPTVLPLARIENGLGFNITVPIPQDKEEQQQPTDPFRSNQATPSIRITFTSNDLKLLDDNIAEYENGKCHVIFDIVYSKQTLNTDFYD